MNKTVLLTGGLGYIGSHTAVEMINAGYEVVVLDDLSNSKESVSSRIEKITGVKPTVYVGDAADKDILRKVFQETGASSVVHFAGFKAVGESVKFPEKYYRNNLDTTLSLLEVMKEFDAKNFIFSSSATVYGESNMPPFTEEMPVGNCTNPYGWTKYMNEVILTDAAKADRQRAEESGAGTSLRVVLLRYFNPIGAHKSGLIGEEPQGIPNNLMPYIQQVASGVRDHLSIYGNDYDTPDGTGVRDYIHVVDLAKGHVKALDYLVRSEAGKMAEHCVEAKACVDAFEQDPSGKTEAEHCVEAKACVDEANSLSNAAQDGTLVINLGTGDGTSVLQAVKAFEKSNGVKIPYEIAPRRAGDIAACYADCTRAERILGWKAELTFEDACRDAWNWEKNRMQLV